MLYNEQKEMRAELNESLDRRNQLTAELTMLQTNHGKQFESEEADDKEGSKSMGALEKNSSEGAPAKPSEIRSGADADSQLEKVMSSEDYVSVKDLE